ncbi:hypothetical protein PHMEG_00017861 [Phytophthora megakarya]|uniref:Integrase catalytic domain-containing protein n=1 Tax=Phytophthora megakarya TaxID=4795 RepID=A0A225VXZ6_9STRA|nr:hypothetical protein PHMEG_00017861 [Phytophthora megakarya]
MVSAVRDFPTPNDAVEAKRFAHLAGYYRRFVNGFGALMAPVTKLLRKGVTWEWGSAQAQAFEKVKAILTAKPLLIYPDFRLPFRVATDASKVGLGACLMQDKGDGWQPVAFASKVNSETESKYRVTELECFSVVWAIKLFRPYLYGRRFEIITDHAALNTSDGKDASSYRATTTSEAKEGVAVSGLTRNAPAMERTETTNLAMVKRDTMTKQRKTVTWTDGKNGDEEEGSASGQLTLSPAGTATVSDDGNTESDSNLPQEHTVTTVATADEAYRPEDEQTSAPRAAVTRSSDEQRRTNEVEDVRRQRVREPTLQLTDAEIIEAQTKSRMVQKMLQTGRHQGKAISKVFGLVVVERPNGRRVVLPPALWSTVFKECHDSVWAGHLRATHTYARIVQKYWWPGLQNEVRRWVRGWQECGSRKHVHENLRGGDVGDRWALDVAGPLPATDGGKKYVVVAVEYVTRYAVTIAVKDHAAKSIAEFLMKQVVLRFGPFREILTDGAPELVGKVIEELVVLLQAQQINPVPYRPQMIGLVERFHRTWKDCVATFMSDERQESYNSGRHSTVMLSPNELMMGRRLRAPNELLRTTMVTEAGDLRRTNVQNELEDENKDDKRVTTIGKTDFEPGDRVWMFRPSRGPKASKFVHQWIVVESAGYDNFLVERENDGKEHEPFIAHTSFLVTYRHPAVLLDAAARDLAEQLEYEGARCREENDEATGTIARATVAPVNSAVAGRGKKRPAEAVESEGVDDIGDGLLVELKRRRRRNEAGQYVLEYLLRPASEYCRRNDGNEGDDGTDERGGRWVSIAEYDQLFNSDKVVEDLRMDGGV